MKIPLTDPCIDDLILDPPVDGRPFKTLKDADIELAWWPDGEYGDTAPATEPWWKGPVVKAQHTLGAVEVTAATQEFYLSRSVIGADLVNYTVVPPGDEVAGWFDSDTDLSKWDIWVGTGTAETTTDPDYLILRPRSAILQDGYMTLTTQFPTSDLYLYGFIGVLVKVPTGVLLPASLDRVVARVALFIDRGDGFELELTEDLALPEPWEYEKEYYLTMQVPIPAGSVTQPQITLFGGDSGVVAFGQVDVTRPANAGALAGSDIVQIGAAVANDQVNVLPGTWDYDTDDVGIDLADNVKYLTDDHEDAWSAFGDWSTFFDTYVVDGPSGPRIVCEQRGSEITGVTLTGEDLSGWSYEIDSSDAASEVIAQRRPDNGVGPQVQVRVSDDDPPNRLVAVEQAPEGLALSDLQRWATSVLASRAPVGTLTGLPVFYDGTAPDSVLSTWGLGDWLTVNIVDGPLDYTIEPTIDALEWDPVKHTVTPTWVVGGRKRDLPEMLAQELRAARRERRKFRPRPEAGSNLSKSETFTDPGDMDDGVPSLTMAIPPGVWQVNAQHSINGDLGGGYSGVTIFTGTESFIGAVENPTGYTSVVSAPVNGPRNITVYGNLAEATAPATTDKTLTVSATQVYA